MSSFKKYHWKSAWPPVVFVLIVWYKTQFGSQILATKFGVFFL